MDKKLMMPHEVATLLKVPIRGVYRLIQDGTLEIIRIGRRIRFDESDVNKLIQRPTGKDGVVK
jgi:excisionase family DNA binding protein